MLCIFSRTYEDAFGLCKHCHEQCDTTCHGAGPGNCTRCKNVKDGPFCVEACPERKYNVGGDCHKCHENCLGGCTGPANTIGFSGCNSCHQAIVHETDGVLTIVSSILTYKSSFQLKIKSKLNLLKIFFFIGTLSGER